jgi:hypothetical protein
MCPDNLETSAVWVKLIAHGEGYQGGQVPSEIVLATHLEVPVVVFAEFLEPASHELLAKNLHDVEGRHSHVDKIDKL